MTSTAGIERLRTDASLSLKDALAILRGEIVGMGAMLKDRCINAAEEAEVDAEVATLNEVVDRAIAVIPPWAVSPAKGRQLENEQRDSIEDIKVDLILEDFPVELLRPLLDLDRDPRDGNAPKAWMVGLGLVESHAPAGLYGPSSIRLSTLGDKLKRKIISTKASELDDTVERMAKAMYGSSQEFPEHTWEKADEDTQTYWREQARSALAAAPSQPPAVVDSETRSKAILAGILIERNSVNRIAQKMYADVVKHGDLPSHPWETTPHQKLYRSWARIVLTEITMLDLALIAVSQGRTRSSFAQEAEAAIDEVLK